MSHIGQTSPEPDEDADRTLATVAAASYRAARRSAELECAVREYVAHLKRAGFPAELVVRRVKDTMAKAGLRNHGHATDAFLDGVVTLSIEEYYRGGEHAGETAAVVRGTAKS